MNTAGISVISRAENRFRVGTTLAKRETTGPPVRHA